MKPEKKNDDSKALNKGSSSEKSKKRSSKMTKILIQAVIPRHHYATLVLVTMIPAWAMLQKHQVLLKMFIVHKKS